jgi:chlorite O(2)-lyase
MRFEEASARYGIFSDFYVGTLIDEARFDEVFA